MKNFKFKLFADYLLNLNIFYVFLYSLLMNQTTQIDLSNSKQIIHSYGNIMLINRTTKVQQSLRKKAPYKNWISEDCLEPVVMKVNRILNSNQIITNITATELYYAIVQFDYSDELVSLLQYLNISSFIIQIRQYSKTEPFFRFKFNISMSSFNANSSLKKSKMESTAESFYAQKNSNAYLLDYVSFKVKRFGNFIICINFIDNSENIVYFSSENLCHDWVNKAVEVGLHYKPLFIVIMYLMCASILFPIAVGKHLMKKYTIERKKKPEKKTEIVSLEKPSKEMEALERNELIPSENINKSKSKWLKNTKAVVFEIESDQSDQDPFQEEEEEHEVDNHILNYKPWISSDKRESTLVNARDKLNSANLNLKKKPLNNTFKNRKKFNSLNNLNTNQRNVNKNRSTTTIYYESNV